MIPTRPATADEQRAFGLAQVKLAEGDDVLQPEALDPNLVHRGRRGKTPLSRME